MKRAKSDRADARHIRELLMIGRLPESWVPPGPRLGYPRTGAGAGPAHALASAWGVAAAHPTGAISPRLSAAGNLTTSEGPIWLSARPLPDGAREQVSVPLGMVDALARQPARLDEELRA
jgi:hypothetical protein